MLGQEGGAGSGKSPRTMCRGDLGVDFCLGRHSHRSRSRHQMLFFSVFCCLSTMFPAPFRTRSPSARATGFPNSRPELLICKSRESVFSLLLVAMPTPSMARGLSHSGDGHGRVEEKIAKEARRRRRRHDACKHKLFLNARGKGVSDGDQERAMENCSLRPADEDAADGG